MAVLDLAVAALALVLLVSGVLKVRDPEATTPMLDAVGLPATRAAVLVVAGAELVVGATTLVVGGRWPTLALTLLYAAFAVVGVVLLRSGAGVPCGCFGQRSATMTPVHVAVDAAAALVGAIAVVAGAPGLYAASTDRSAGVLVVATVAAVLLAAVVVALLTVIPERLSSPSRPSAPAFSAAPAGSSATNVAAAAPGAALAAGRLPIVEGLTPWDDPVLVEVAGSDRIVLLAFLTSGCTTCSHFWSVFRTLPSDGLPGEGTDLVIVVRGDDQENPARVRDLAPPDHLVVRSSAAWADYGVEAGPYFVLLDGRRDRSLGEGTATAWSDVEALVGHAVGAGRGTGPAE